MILEPTIEAVAKTVADIAHLSDALCRKVAHAVLVQVYKLEERPVCPTHGSAAIDLNGVCYACETNDLLSKKSRNEIMRRWEANNAPAGMLAVSGLAKADLCEDCAGTDGATQCDTCARACDQSESDDWHERADVMEEAAKKLRTEVAALTAEVATLTAKLDAARKLWAALPWAPTPDTRMWIASMDKALRHDRDSEPVKRGTWCTDGLHMWRCACDGEYGRVCGPALAQCKRCGTYRPVVRAPWESDANRTVLNNTALACGYEACERERDAALADAVRLAEQANEVAGLKQDREELRKTLRTLESHIAEEAIVMETVCAERDAARAEVATLRAQIEKVREAWDAYYDGTYLGNDRTSPWGRLRAAVAALAPPQSAPVASEPKRGTWHADEYAPGIRGWIRTTLITNAAIAAAPFVPKNRHLGK